MTVFVDRKFPLCDYTTDYAAGATRYAAFHVTHSAYMCFIRVLRQVAVTGATWNLCFYVTHADFLSCNVYAKGCSASLVLCPFTKMSGFTMKDMTESISSAMTEHISSEFPCDFKHPVDRCLRVDSRVGVVWVFLLEICSPEPCISVVHPIEEIADM